MHIYLNYVHLQASGEAKYLSDSANDVDELHATYVMAEVGNADIDSINATVAETMTGFHSIITGEIFEIFILFVNLHVSLNSLILSDDI